MIEKIQARRQAAERRAAARGDATAPLLAALVAYAGAGAACAGTVAGYLPIGSETDPLAAMAILAQTRTVAVPVVEAADRPLRFRAWTPQAVLVPGPLGTRHPVEGDWIVPDVVIVPCLAFDRYGMRLGYGGGFYDRTLDLLRRRGHVVAIGLAFAAQEVDRLPREATDQLLDLIVTETGALVPG